VEGIRSKNGGEKMSIFNDPNFDEMFSNSIYISREDSIDGLVDVGKYNGDDWLYDDDDYQPTHYEECQDLHGGDDYVEQWEVDDYGDY
jgi:hypothetical protein